MNAIPIWIFFAATVLLVMLSVEAGYRLGRSIRRRTEEEKESPVSAFSGATLGLLAFVLAFTFAIATDRYDARKALVREEAGALRTAFARAEFLPEPDRSETAALLRGYLQDRVHLAEEGDVDRLREAMIEADLIHRRLWEMAVANARLDMGSDVAALYIEAVNEVVNVHWQRIAVGAQARIPGAVWLMLCTILVFAMLGVGYQTGIAASRRTWATLLLALSFSLIVTLIADLDRPHGGWIRVSQQPLADLSKWMEDRGGEP